MQAQPQFAWSNGHYRRTSGIIPGTQTALYRLTNLIDRGLMYPRLAKQFLDSRLLQDVVWQVTWADAGDTPDEHLDYLLDNAEGFVVFVHGWTGNHRIWEGLPGLVVREYPHLISIAIDHNGFGNTRFQNQLPRIEDCNPPAGMETLQQLIDLLRIRRQPGDSRPRVINLVGHSMGGAMLFYLNPFKWRYGEFTRYALAPALLLEDEAHQAFYNALGMGIHLLQRIPILEFVEQFIKPQLIDILCNGSSVFVKNEHTRQYRDTPRGVTGATLRAMGILREEDYPIAHDWDTFRVILGHKDNLVGLSPMFDLLGHLQFPVRNIRAVPGSHYMFSVAEAAFDPSTRNEAVYQHAQSRDVIVQDIIELHQLALDLQKTGKRIGTGHK